MLPLTQTQTLELHGTKSVFISAIRYAMSMVEHLPIHGADLKFSAREQVEFMLETDKDTPQILSHDDVKSVIRTGISNSFTFFESELQSLLSDPNLKPEPGESRILQRLSDIEWIFNLLTKMDLMKDFITHWSKTSLKVLEVIEQERFNSCLLSLKIKTVEITGKALEAVGYGTVILPASDRARLVNTWLPFIRKTKACFEEMGEEVDCIFAVVDKDLWQSIEGAVVSLVSALPSGDQAEILTEWLREMEQGVRFPDMSEAFEVWCYRSKSAERRLLERCDRLVDDETGLKRS